MTAPTLSLFQPTPLEEIQLPRQHTSVLARDRLGRSVKNARGASLEASFARASTRLRRMLADSQSFCPPTMAPPPSKMPSAPPLSMEEQLRLHRAFRSCISKSTSKSGGKGITSQEQLSDLLVELHVQVPQERLRSLHNFVYDGPLLADDFVSLCAVLQQEELESCRDKNAAAKEDESALTDLFEEMTKNRIATPDQPASGEDEEEQQDTVGASIEASACGGSVVSLREVGKALSAVGIRLDGPTMEREAEKYQQEMQAATCKQKKRGAAASNEISTCNQKLLPFERFLKAATVVSPPPDADPKCGKKVSNANAGEGSASTTVKNSQPSVAKETEGTLQLRKRALRGALSRASFLQYVLDPTVGENETTDATEGNQQQSTLQVLSPTSDSDVTSSHALGDEDDADSDDAPLHSHSQLPSFPSNLSQKNLFAEQRAAARSTRAEQRKSMRSGPILKSPALQRHNETYACVDADDAFPISSMDYHKFNFTPKLSRRPSDTPIYFRNSFPQKCQRAANQRPHRGSHGASGSAHSFLKAPQPSEKRPVWVDRLHSRKRVWYDEPPSSRWKELERQKACEEDALARRRECMLMRARRAAATPTVETKTMLRQAPLTPAVSSVHRTRAASANATAIRLPAHKSFGFGVTYRDGSTCAFDFVLSVLSQCTKSLQQ